MRRRICGRAVQIVAIADIVMSLDNVIAVAAAANGSVPLLVLGLAISVPLIVAGAALIMALLTKLPILVWAGAALLGWIAGEVMATDPAVDPQLRRAVRRPARRPARPGASDRSASACTSPMAATAAKSFCGILGIIIVLVAGSIWRKRALQKHAEHAAKAA